MPNLTLYELAGADPALRFSPYCWKTRMALAHKGLEASRIPWRFTDKEMIGFSGQGLVPVLVDGATTVYDSWQIAIHLERAFPDRPSLFADAAAMALTVFINRWSDSALGSAVARIILHDVYLQLAPEDQPYFRASREKRFGQSLEKVVADRSGHLAELQRTLMPLRQTLKDQPYLGGDRPIYADYCVFGMFMWARCVSAIELLPADDPIWAWRERLLDAFDGLARAAPAVQQM